jgi:hypothetical protein
MTPPAAYPTNLPIAEKGSGFYTRAKPKEFGFQAHGG